MLPDMIFSPAAAPSPGVAPIEDLMMTAVNARAVLEKAKRASDLAENALADAITQKTTDVTLSTVVASGMPVDVLTLDYSPLLNEFDEPHSSLPLIVQLSSIDAVFKSAKRSKPATVSGKRARMAKDPKTAKPSQPRKRQLSMSAPVPDAMDSVPLGLLCTEDRSTLFDC